VSSMCVCVYVCVCVCVLIGVAAAAASVSTLGGLSVPVGNWILKFRKGDD